MKYSLSEIAGICLGRLVGEDVAVDCVSVDSRSLTVHGRQPLFVAIAGRNHDGHTYINELYARGIRGFVIERDVNTGKYPDAGFVRVDSAVEALQALAADYRGRFPGKVVGITGSNGKTIVKEWVASLAPDGVALFRSPKSYNSQIGVPLSLLMMEGREDVAVIEAGISRPGEMERLVRIVRPDITVVTTIGDAHQENFCSVEQKIAEKMRLADSSHTVIYNSAYPEVAAYVRDNLSDEVSIDTAGQSEAYGFFRDKASRENAAAAVAVWDALGYDHAATVSRLGGLQSVAMRLEMKEGIGGSLIINDFYNSDINALGIAIDYMKSVAGSRPQMLILSDILQSGLDGRELYGRVARMVEETGIDRFVGIGRDISAHRDLFGAGAEFYAVPEDFLAHLATERINGRAVLIKGHNTAGFGAVSHALQLHTHTTTLDVDLDAMIYNLEAHRTLLRPGVRMMAMVKAGSYGHGHYEVANMLQGKGVDYLAVAYADEGMKLRRAGITMPIVVLNADSDSFDTMVAARLEPEIYSAGSLAAFAATVRRYGERAYPIHIKVDTGMHRLGFVPGIEAELGRLLNGCSDSLRVASVFSHLAVSDEPSQDAFTRRQVALFEGFCSGLSEAVGYRPLRHIANSAAIVRFPDAQFDMVRLGVGLYGVGEIGGVPLRKVATLRTRIVQIKHIPAGETVGYGRDGRSEHDMTTATIPVGYADGIDRRLGNGGWAVSIGGRPAQTVGRICMDTCMVDITGIEAREGDEVVVFGPQEGFTVEDMARVLGTIPYEVMTSVAGRVKRIYTKE